MCFSDANHPSLQQQGWRSKLQNPPPKPKPTVQKKFNHTFVVREGEECQEIWTAEGGDPDTCPEQLITFCSTDGQDGLMWPDWESFWVEYGLHPESLDGKRLAFTLLGHLMNNQKGDWEFTPEEKLQLIALISGANDA